MSQVRCFVGIPLPACIADPLVGACLALREADPAWRDEKWILPENLHITVKFLGMIDEEALPSLQEAIGTAVGPISEFELPFAGIHAHPNARRCRMLWASFFDPADACAALAESVQRAALGFGVEPETRAFRAHATLCRARRPKPVSEQGMDAAADALEAVPELMSVPSASLFTSRLTPRGPIYTEIGAWRLRGD